MGIDHGQKYSATDRAMKGLDGLLKNLSKIEQSGVQSVTTAVLFVKAESQKITPVDTSNLVDWAYTDVQVVGAAVNGEIGYTAYYAPYVHEMPADTNWQKPEAENKFLEKALLRNERKIMRIMAGELKIK